MRVMRAAVLAWCVAAGATAQTLPSEPIALGGGRVTLGGEVSASVAPEEAEYFDATDYDTSAIRLVRASLTGSWRPMDRLAVLGELRAQSGLGLRPYGLYVRLTPVPARRIDFQIGRIPPVFGAYGRRSYGTGNPLVGVPLAYQYLTSLRTDALPASADDLIRMRAQGWLSSFPIGSKTAAAGLPLVNPLRWESGVQARVGFGVFEAAMAVTTGSLSNPRVRDDNGGKQLSGRLEWRPVIGLIIGGSAARGAFIARSALQQLPASLQSGDYTQGGAGADVEYSRDHWLWRSEVVLSRWSLPRVRAPFIDSPLQALAVSTEGRYTLFPGAYAAARVEHLGFSRIAGTTQDGPWEAPVSRLEVGGGYYLQRNLVLKAAIQQNWRDGGEIRTKAFGALQVLYWF